MHKAYTPADIARQLRADELKARASRTGKVRGLSAEWFANHAAAFELVLKD
jgi:predicted nucleic acid-binding protein